MIMTGGKGHFRKESDARAVELRKGSHHAELAVVNDELAVCLGMMRVQCGSL